MKSKSPIPFYRHDFSAQEINVVTKVLKGKWITGGPENIGLEEAIGAFTMALDTVALSSATAGLFLSLKLFGIKPGDEVITTPYSFVATANVICECGATPVFADIGPDYNLTPDLVAKKITPRTKAIVAVDYGGYPCDYKGLRKIPGIPFRPTNLFQEALGRPLILADSAHSIGTVYRGVDDDKKIREGKRQTSYNKKNKEKNKIKKVSHFELLNYADIHCYSFHAVKNITCGEGGITCLMNHSLVNAGMGEQMKRGRVHGLSRDAYQREKERMFFYDMKERGYKYNLSEMAAALARIQFKRINSFKRKKDTLKQFYDKHFADMPGVKLRPQNPLWKGWQIHPHLYTLEWEKFTVKGGTSQSSLAFKQKFFQSALEAGLSLNFHFLPIPLLSYYRKRGYNLHCLPATASLYPRHFSLPFYSSLTKAEASRVVEIIFQLIRK